jgi:hypothetical protein
MVAPGLLVVDLELPIRIGERLGAKLAALPNKKYGVVLSSRSARAAFLTMVRTTFARPASASLARLGAEIFCSAIAAKIGSGSDRGGHRLLEGRRARLRRGAHRGGDN